MEKDVIVSTRMTLNAVKDPVKVSSLKNKIIKLNAGWDKWKITGKLSKECAQRVSVYSYSTLKNRNWKL